MNRYWFDRTIRWYAGFLIAALGLQFLVPFPYLPWMAVSVGGHAVPIHLILFGGFGLISFLMAAWIVWEVRQGGAFLWAGLLLAGCVGLSAFLAPESRGASLKIFFGVACRLIFPAFSAYSVARYGGKEPVLRRWLLIWSTLCSLAALYEVVSHHYFLFHRDYTNINLGDLFTPDQGIALGPVGHPLTFSALMCLAFPLALQVWSDRKSVMAFLAVLAIFLGIVFAYRRSGWVLSALALAAWALLNQHQFPLWRRFFVIVLLWVACVAVAWRIPLARQNLTVRFDLARTKSDLSTGNRVKNVGAAWHMFRDHALLGVGIGQFPHFQSRYLPNVSADGTAADSQYARWLAETGACGFFALILWLGVALWIIGRRMGEPYWGAAVVAIVVFLLNIIITDLLLWPTVQMAFGVLLGAAAGGVEATSERRS